MERYMWLHVVAGGKIADYKATFEALMDRMQELGFERAKMYEVQDRKPNMVCVVAPEATPEENEQAFAKLGSDERLQELQREWREEKMLIDGASEIFHLVET
jgi:quinolinate synthase